MPRAGPVSGFGVGSGGGTRIENDGRRVWRMHCDFGEWLCKVFNDFLMHDYDHQVTHDAVDKVIANINQKYKSKATFYVATPSEGARVLKMWNSEIVVTK